VIAEVQKLVAVGSREIVLSGINLGAYGRDLSPRAGLSDVIQRILRETSLEQLRLSSIEPQDVTEELISLIARSPRVAAHFHVPLQSGSDRILRAMHRWYRAAHYAERVERIRQISPDAAIGADVIAGFPGETDEDFQATYELIERLPFTYLHVFSFSGRPGTEGANLPASVPAAIIRERARTLRALARKKSSEFRSAQAGRVFRALTLVGGEGSWTPALTANYLKVRIPGRLPANEWHETAIFSDETLMEDWSPPASFRK
jgi:threonylcarbamoyladenosine tRNA methylthiotransferase MtaB